MPAVRTRESLSLDVTMDAPHLPALTIISPTPRAFTFPTTHNLDGSPDSSPSNSPFEPEAYPCTRIRTPPPPLARLSPGSTLLSSSSIHKRRKSSISSISGPSNGDVVERRPKKGDEDYIKRPENAFILFRRKCCEDRQAAAAGEESADIPTKKQRQADLSKAISQQWKSLPSEERQYWEGLAKEKKKEHEQMYPNYVYRPQRAKDKDGRSKSRKPAKASVRKGASATTFAELEHETDSESIHFALPLRYPQQSGRSASAPTPPPYQYQMMSVPNVFMTPSCPTSPTLPTVSVRSSHCSQSEDTWPTFEYLPQSSFTSSAYGQNGQFDSSIQPSESLQSLYNLPHHHHHQHGTELHRLTMPHESVIPHPHVLSPVSTGSSPNSSPYTPSTLLTHSFSHLSTSNSTESSGVSTPQTQAEIDLQMEFASYSWENNSLWPTTTGGDIHGNDFDLSSIPTAQLDMAKFNTEGFEPLDMGVGMNMGVNVAMEYGHPVHAPNVEGLMAFDDMMTGHTFH